MDTSALRWFQQVADGATVTEVSELELTSQPGISRALARLSEQVGTPLLRRQGRLLRLTRAGAAFKRHVDAVLHHLDDGLAAVAQVTDPESGVVTLAFQPSLGAWLVPQLVADFRVAHPDVVFDLRSWPNEATPATGEDTDIDLELTASRHGPDSHHWYPVARESIRLITARDYPLPDAPVRLETLAGASFIAMRPSSHLRRLTDELLAREGIETEIAYIVDDLPSLYGYVAAGLGLALAPERPHPGVAIRPLASDAAFRDIGLSWPKEHRLLPSAALFRDHVLATQRRGPTPHPAT